MGLLQAKFAVRTETHQFKAFIVWLAVNKHQIGAQVAIPVIVPFAGKRVVEMARRQRLIVREKIHRVQKQLVEFLTEYSRLFAAIIALEARLIFNRPHSSS